MHYSLTNHPLSHHIPSYPIISRYISCLVNYIIFPIYKLTIFGKDDILRPQNAGLQMSRAPSRDLVLGSAQLENTRGLCLITP